MFGTRRVAFGLACGLFLVGVAAMGAARVAHGSATAANVAVVARGFSQHEEEIGVGFVLRNTSKLDALDVRLTYNLAGAGGRLIASDSQSIQVIPAGATYYTGDEVDASSATARARQLEVFVQVGQSVSHRYRLPQVSHVAVVVKYGTVRVQGEIKNTLAGTLDGLARVGIVVFDRAGKVVGGGFTYPDTSIPRGMRVLFDAISGVDTVPPAKAASARASVENEGAESEPMLG